MKIDKEAMPTPKQNEPITDKDILVVSEKTDQNFAKFVLLHLKETKYDQI